MNRADKQETERRVLKISEMLLDGESTYSIIRYYQEHYKIGTRQSRKYIKSAREKWKKIYEDEFENNLNWHLIARRRLYNKCIKNNDYGNARKILNDIADIQGIVRKRQDVNTTGTWTFEKLRDELAEKLERLEAEVAEEERTGIKWWQREENQIR